MATDDVRGMFDSPYLGAWDLQGRDVVVTIRDVVQGELGKAGTSKKDKAPIVYFEGKEKGMVFNKTNMKTVAAIYGSFKRTEWLGKSITLFPTTTSKGGEIVDCIRVRPNAPREKAAA